MPIRFNTVSVRPRLYGPLNQSTSNLVYDVIPRKGRKYGVHSLPKLHSPTYHPIMRY